MENLTEEFESGDQGDGNRNEKEEVAYITPVENLLMPETCILAKFVSGKRKSTLYKYICKIRERFFENDFAVVGSKSVNLDNTKFNQRDAHFLDNYQFIH